MCWHLWYGFVAITALGGGVGANPLGFKNWPGNASIFGSQFENLMLRDTDEFDQTDLSFIKSMAAIGDSYSAGIGAGDRLGNAGQAFDTGSDWSCSRYDHSYPYLINTDQRLGDPAARTFQFESCSGAVIADVLSKQIPKLSGNQQVILLSAGGNDAELSNILNQCIFQWAVLTSTQVLLAKAAALLHVDYEWAKDFDWDTLGLGCEGQLARSEKIIGGDAFSKSLDSVLNAAKAKLGPGGMVYYTGYAKFWAEDLSSACDSVTWRTWTYLLYDIFQPAQTLNQAHRRTMNKLVDAVNAQISAAVKRAGPSVKFVDYDSYVGYFNGRFCEAGVDESTTESNTRTGLMFYELSSKDLFGASPWKRDTDNPRIGTFKGSVNQFAEITLLMDPDAKLAEQSFVTDASTVASVGELKDFNTLESEVPNVLPDGYGRVFHPQILLHQVIASLVIYEMVNVNEQSHGFPAIPETLTFDSCPYYPPTGDSPGTAGGQQIALASYIHPLAGPDAWNRMIDYPVDKVSVLVANVINGPGAVVDKDWESVINRAFDKGKRIIGYVRTGYLGVSVQKFQTRLGSHVLADWVAQIQSDVDLWYQMYPGKISGIFFDEGWNDCGPDNQYSELYRLITDTTKRKHPGAFTVLNPGATMPQCFEHSADTLMTHENSYEAYMNSYSPNPWTASDPRKIWHIIYNVPAAAAVEVAALALKRGAGLIHITSDVEPNPYDTIPDEAYMQSLMNAVTGGKPLAADPLPFPGDGRRATQPNGFGVTKHDYSSVSLSWIASSSDVPLAFVVYLDGAEITRLPGTMSQVTIGNLDPGSSRLEFTLRSIGGDGSQSPLTAPVYANTEPLPGGTVVNVTVSSTATTTTYQANVLVPYAFLRVYISDPDLACTFPAWPINYNAWYHVCAHYMLEDQTLYKYNGPLLLGDATNYPWSWTQTGEWANVQVERNGYNYKWTLPIGKSTVDPNYFAIQAEGYGPKTNVFAPCPDHWTSLPSNVGATCVGDPPYDCKGQPLCKTTNVKYCDKAINQMTRGSKIYRANGDSLAISGNCWANYEQFGCSVQIRGKDDQGKDCTITGDDMWKAYQDIRNIGSCDTCGSKHFGNGCLVSVDYYYGCDNRDSGPN